MPTARRLSPFLLTFFIITAAVGGTYHGRLFDTWQEKIVDRFFLRQDAPRDIVIIAIDNESIQKVGGWPFKRALFATAIERLENADRIGIDVSFSEPSLFGGEDDAVLADVLRRNKNRVVLPIQIESGSNLVLYPIKVLRTESILGVTNSGLDSDGIVRQHRTIQNNNPSFATLLAQKSDAQQFRIAFRGPEKTVLTIPFIDLIESRVPKRVTQGKTVLIGATAPDLHDTVLTPFGVMSGVELHANILYTLQSASFFKEIGSLYSFFGIALLNLLAVVLVFFIKRFIILAFVLLGAFLAIFLGSALLFDFFIIFPVLYLLLGFVITTGSTIALGYIVESKEKRLIRKGFHYYLSEDVVNQILESPEKLKLGGETKKVTILFSDIRGFTTISETLSPQDLMSKLNAYLTAMTDIIMEKRGLVDKYIGDAVMAFWGAPLENNSQAEDACMSVLAQMHRLEELNMKWQEQGASPFHIGVGLNTGLVVVGNMGSEKRFNYTIIGDEVNFASRLEGLNKSYGTSCLISESTKKEIEGNSAFHIRELDLVVVKGKKEPKLIFELITRDMTPELQKILGLFARGREQYIKGDWKEAAVLFQEALVLGEDGPSKLFLERCEELMTNPPPTWTGVYEFKTK